MSEDTPLAAIVNFRQALKRLERHMGRLIWYDPYGAVVVDSAQCDDEGNIIANRGGETLEGP